MEMTNKSKAAAIVAAASAVYDAEVAAARAAYDGACADAGNRMDAVWVAARLLAELDEV